MAIFNFTLPIYGFDQWSASASTNNTVSYPNGTTFTLDPSAALTIVNVQDDDGNAADSPDNQLDDGFIDTPGDGSSPSTANNDQLLTQAVTINGQNFDIGDQVELEFAFTTTDGESFFVIRIDGQNVGISGETLPTPGTTYEVASSSDGEFSPIEDVPCFLDGTLIRTPSGDTLIENLKSGDLVTTLDGTAKRIRWVGRRKVTPLELQFFPELKPIVISSYAIERFAPTRPLSVSANHRVMLVGSNVEFYFGIAEVLVSAKHLLNGKTVRHATVSDPFNYHHLLLEDHEILIANGLPVESLYPGFDQSRYDTMIDQDLHGQIGAASAPFARPVLRKHEACVLCTS
ncbi:MAG: Hint domain-containing protein [Pseudomonadota bacterium]